MAKTKGIDTKKLAITCPHLLDMRPQVRSIYIGIIKERVVPGKGFIYNKPLPKDVFDIQEKKKTDDLRKFAEEYGTTIEKMWELHRNNEIILKTNSALYQVQDEDYKTGSVFPYLVFGSDKVKYFSSQDLSKESEAKLEDSISKIASGQIRKSWNEFTKIKEMDERIVKIQDQIEVQEITIAANEATKATSKALSAVHKAELTPSKSSIEEGEKMIDEGNKVLANSNEKIKTSKSKIAGVYPVVASHDATMVLNQVKIGAAQAQLGKLVVDALPVDLPVLPKGNKNKKSDFQLEVEKFLSNTKKAEKDIVSANKEKTKLNGELKRKQGTRKEAILALYSVERIQRNKAFKLSDDDKKRHAVSDKRAAIGIIRETVIEFSIERKTKLVFGSAVFLIAETRGIDKEKLNIQIKRAQQDEMGAQDSEVEFVSGDKDMKLFEVPLESFVFRKDGITEEREHYDGRTYRGAIFKYKHKVTFQNGIKDAEDPKIVYSAFPIMLLSKNQETNKKWKASLKKSSSKLYIQASVSASYKKDIVYKGLKIKSDSKFSNSWFSQRDEWIDFEYIPKINIYQSEGENGKIGKIEVDSEDKKVQYSYITKEKREIVLLTTDILKIDKVSQGVKSNRWPSHFEEIKPPKNIINKALASLIPPVQEYEEKTKGKQIYRYSKIGKGVCVFGRHNSEDRYVLYSPWSAATKSEDKEPTAIIAKIVETFRFPELNMYFSLASERKYLGLYRYAAFLGALYECGFDIIHPLLLNGGCYDDGTCWPSVSHVNGEAFDTEYIGRDNLPVVEDQDTFIKALRRFGFKTHIIGDSPNLSGIKEGNLRNAEHNNHLHSQTFEPEFT